MTDTIKARAGDEVMSDFPIDPPTANFQIPYLQIGANVRIWLKDGKVELLNGVTPDAAAKAFWEQIEKFYPKPACPVEPTP